MLQLIQEVFLPMDHALRVRQQFVMATGRITFGSSCKMDTLNFELPEMHSLSIHVTTLHKHQQLHV